MDELVHLLLTYHVISCKSDQVMGVDLTWQLTFNIAEQRQHGERGHRADNGSKPKSDTHQDADGRCNPDRSGGGQATYRQTLFEDDPRAKQADARHDGLRHAGRIGPNGVML